MLMLKYRDGTQKDLDILAQWNYQLIRDEGHRNTMTPPQLRERMNGWIRGEYKAVIFEIGQDPVAYALYKEGAEEIYLRQLFVIRSHRRQGVGRKIVEILRKQIWPADKRLTVEVLTNNEPAIRFWRSVGYTDYCLTLEILPRRER